MSQQLSLREAIPSDADNLLVFLKKASEQSSFISYEDLNTITKTDEEVSLDEIYQSEFDELILAIFDEQIIGYCRLENIDNSKAEFGVVVERNFWNNGIASYLLEDALDWAQHSQLNEVVLEVYENNSAAIHVYQKYGFELESKNKKTLKMKKMV